MLPRIVSVRIGFLTSHVQDCYGLPCELLMLVLEVFAKQRFHPFTFLFGMYIGSLYEPTLTGEIKHLC